MNQNKVEVFGSVFCPYCKQARTYLDARKIKYDYREVPMAFGMKLPLPTFFEMKRRSGGKTSVPQIFIDGEYYGDEERLFEDDRQNRISTNFGVPPKSADFYYVEDPTEDEESEAESKT